MDICGEQAVYIPQTSCDDCENLIQSIEELRQGKQDKLEAGDNITIEGNRISATASAAYSAGDGISITNNVISADRNPTNTYSKTDVDLLLRDKQDGLQAGQNISISGNTISATDTKYYAGDGLTLSGTTFNAERNPSNTYTKSEVDALIPTKVSDLTNDSGYQNQTQVEQLILNELGNFERFDYKIVTALPATGEQGVRYLIKNANDTYEEWIFLNGQFYDIGSTGTTGPLVIPINPSPVPTAEGAIWFTT